MAHHVPEPGTIQPTAKEPGRKHAVDKKMALAWSAAVVVVLVLLAIGGVLLLGT